MSNLYHIIQRPASARLETFVAGGGVSLGAVAFRAGAECRGTVLYLNGTQSHAGWFHREAELLQQDGYDVLCLDRRGSGINREGPGIVAGHIDRYETLIGDLDAALALARPDSPVFLAGVSWGGRLALAYALLRPGKIRGLVLITPALVPRIQPPRLMRYLVPILSVVHPQKAFTFRAPTAAFTTVEGIGDYIDSDPLRLDVMSARFLAEHVRLQTVLARALPHPVPVQAFLADGDRIVDSDATEALLESRCGTDLTVIRYEGCGHGLVLEQADRLSAEASRWMSQQLQQSA
jgi:acylglycerol lipase